MFAKEKLRLSTGYFRNCIKCGAFSFREVTMLCSRCESQLERLELFGARVHSPLPFPVYALFSWTLPADPVLRPLLYALKGGRCSNAYLPLAQRLSWRLPRAPLQRRIFIPPPSHGVPEDHAYRWASALADVWSGEVGRYLEFTDRNEALAQKKKSREERSERAFCLVKNANSLRQRPLVFADDILTTGATALAAFKALGRPKNFEVWAIAWRPPVARESAF